MYEQIGQWMPYNFAAESFYTKQIYSSLSSSEVYFLDGNEKIVIFVTHFGG